jgi:hypothetical protein
MCRPQAQRGGGARAATLSRLLLRTRTTGGGAAGATRLPRRQGLRGWRDRLLGPGRRRTRRGGRSGGARLRPCAGAQGCWAPPPVHWAASGRWRRRLRAPGRWNCGLGGVWAVAPPLRAFGWATGGTGRGGGSGDRGRRRTGRLREVCVGREEPRRPPAALPLPEGYAARAVRPRREVYAGPAVPLHRPEDAAAGLRWALAGGPAGRARLGRDAGPVGGADRFAARRPGPSAIRRPRQPPGGRRRTSR